MSSGRDDSSCREVPSRLLFRPWEGERTNSSVQSGAVDEDGQRFVTEWQHPTLHLLQFLCGIFACSNFRTGESQITKISLEPGRIQIKAFKNSTSRARKRVVFVLVVFLQGSSALPFLDLIVNLIDFRC